MTFQIGVDGGATKTECILVDDAGVVLARHLAPGCNPNVVGAEQARLIVTDALCAVLAQARAQVPALRVSATQLFMAGSAVFWRELVKELVDFGQVTTAADSLPVLELATDGAAGLVLHSGTGSFVAARDREGKIHYAGGLGWRFGDPGSAYDLGRRAISRALLELQGWARPSRLGPAVRDHTQLGADVDAAAVTRFFYSDDSPNKQIGALAPVVLHLAREGDTSAHQLIVESVNELFELALHVAAKLFSGEPLDEVKAGLSGPILTHPVVLETLAPRMPLPLVPITEPPIEGVRRLLVRNR